MLKKLLKKTGVYATRSLLGLLVILAILIWFAGTESALRWGAQQAVHLSEGKLTLSAVHGSLYGPLKIESLSFQNEEKRFEVKGVNLNWSPSSLFSRHILLNQFTLQELKIIEIKPSEEPITLPETLRIPLALSASSITIKRIVIKNNTSEQVLSDISLSVDKPADTYKLNLRNIATEWGKAQGTVALGDTQPFKVTAHISLLQTAGTAYHTVADASGNLSQLQLNAKATALGGQAVIAAKLTPFETFPLAQAHITANSMNPALLRKDLPKGDLSADITVVRQGEKDLKGKIQIRNALPGSWDAARLPVRELVTQFAGALDHMNLSGIHLDLAEGGAFKGSGQIKDQQIQLTLATTNFNPKGAHSKMKPMKLAGDIRLQASAHNQQVAADLRYQRFQLHLDAQHQNAVVELREASVKSGAGSLALHGTLALEGNKAFQLAGALEGFNPSDFGDYPAAKVNAAFTGTGHLEAEPEATVGFSIVNSHFRKQPLSGQGNLHVSTKRIWDSSVLLKLASNRLEAKGALGTPGDRLNILIDAANLSAFDPELHGQIHAKGDLQGRFAAPSGDFDATLKDLSWRKAFRIANLQTEGKLEKGIDGSLSLKTTLQGLTTPQLQLDQASLAAQGTLIKHTLQFQAKNPDFDLNSQFSGGYQEKSGWAGQILSLVNQGHHKLALKSPAKLEVAEQHVLLNNAHFDFVGAKLIVHELAYNAGQITSRGELKGLPLTYLQGLAKEETDIQTDLTLGGEWQLAVQKNINGHIALWRERGDVTFPSIPRPTLGLSRLTLNVDAVNNQLQSRLEAAGANLGSFKANAQTMLSARNGSWGIAGDALVNGNIDLAMESLAWIKPLFDKTGALTFDGALKSQIKVGGTFAQPKLTGNITGDRFIVAWPDQGLNFKDGRFKAELQDQVLHLKELILHGGDGNITGQGRLAFESGAPAMQLSLKADKLSVLSRPDRLLIISGSSDASIAGKEIKLTAQLKADRGLIELPKNDTPTPSDDVIVLGRTKIVEKKPPPYNLSFNFDMDMGEKFFIKGKGLDAQLGGGLTLKSTNNTPLTSRGSIRVVKGTYSAYGQNLKIERGILNFQGPIDNPGLNITALRKNQQVEAGVAITGTAQSPTVNLVSNPTVPDSEKLSWLVLGHGLENSSGSEFSALQAAAGALLAAGDSVSLQQKIAHSAGLEEVSLSGAGGLESTVLTLGKRLSSRAYLSYEQGLTGVSSIVKINYTLTKRISVRAQAGTTPAVDLFYTFSFD
ncbi:translocation/assembly module TamB domain-containing protein [Sulfurirhabdus autotrophica]|uniref:Autotransporter secretion inner membrane protein TamB n=1 Tax=Sulfurirhabdus autotrophica TaxID=1706046 RepID=A0A4V2W2R4_9PROT|nr:translocation/assembly module TamB domain-containing protein [Sulfurirhabdus autotrophica]TCV89059.1 autotransporter secretion inner membrane protein TamB [Sulfurirhabdus autotrophica]